MQNHRLKGKNKNQVQYLSGKIRSCRVLNWRLGGNLTGYTFVQTLRLNVQNTKKSSLIHYGKIMIMPNTKFQIGSIFDYLYFQAKTQILLSVRTFMFRCVSVDFIPFWVQFFLQISKMESILQRLIAQCGNLRLCQPHYWLISITLSDSHSTDISVNIVIHTEFEIFSYAYLFSVNPNLRGLFWGCLFAWRKSVISPKPLKLALQNFLTFCVCQFRSI